MKYYSGIDLGGTKIYSIIIDENGKILGRNKEKTNSGDDFNNIIKRIYECYNGVLKKSKISNGDVISIGMAVPGAFNVEKGLLIKAPNLSWKNIELTKIMTEIFNKPFFIDNDANLGVYGEYLSENSSGLKEKTDTLYGIFVGTGIGGGYISGGNIIRGKNYTAGEIGHIIMKIGGPLCNCGQRGCFEAISGKIGIINYIKKNVEKKNDKTLLDEINPDWKTSVGSKALKKCYLKNDRLVVKAVIRSAKVIGIFCANLINLTGIDNILLGGGVIEELGDIMLPLVKKYMESYSFGNGAKGVNLIKAKLGDDAIALGAAFYSSQEQHL